MNLNKCVRSLRYYKFLFAGIIIFSSSAFILPPFINKILNEDNSANLWSTKKDIVFLLFSSPLSALNRQVIRDTWLSLPSDLDFSVYFSIGTKILSTEEINNLNDENKKYGDLLLLPNLYDTYSNLTYKLVESLIWLQKYKKAKYLFKGDDDSFVWLEKFSNAVNEKPKTKLYWGFFYGNANVKKVGKWAESQWVLCDQYLPYSRGGGYVISWDLVEYITNNQHLLQKFKSEDVSMGAWLGPLNIERHHDVRFDTEYRSRGCSQQYIVTHKQSPDMMRSLVRTIKNRNRMCRAEIKVRLSYEYNWNVPPSQCCIKNDSSIP